jgi:hypothetical protein
MGDEDTQGKPRFEPPPWEREAFEVLAAKRAEQEAVARATAAAPAEAGSESPEDASADPGVVRTEQEADGKPGEQAAPAKEVAAPDSVAVQAMMQQLAREEFSSDRTTRIVAWVAAGVTAVLGVSMFIAGLSVGARSEGKTASVIGSVVLTVFGLAFVGMSVWVWVSANRVRGR